VTVGETVDNTGYIINGLLVLTVLRQIRETRLDTQSLVLPIALVTAAAAYYLRSIPTAGNDGILELTMASIGITLGTLCARFTVVRRTNEGNLVCRATAIAATLWITGIGSRIAFPYSTSHGLGHTIATISQTHNITSSTAWTAALIMMALTEVISRATTLHLRARRATSAA
jgi:hypothetical protein